MWSADAILSSEPIITRALDANVVITSAEPVTEPTSIEA
jgi:hypothetical protein